MHCVLPHEVVSHENPVGHVGMGEPAPHCFEMAPPHEVFGISRTQIFAGHSWESWQVCPMGAVAPGQRAGFCPPAPEAPDVPPVPEAPPATLPPAPDAPAAALPPAPASEGSASLEPQAAARREVETSAHRQSKREVIPPP